MMKPKDAAIRFIKLCPDDVFGWKLAGVASFYLGNYDDAQKYLLHAVSIDRKDPELLSNLGNALRNQSRMKEAIDCYDRSLQIDAEHAPALSGKALCLMELDRNEEALSLLKGVRIDA
ncbi:MAG: tetratricopeptide repeat protein [Chromatiales bacterium]|nr:tetratricopeptide repeat protein [Chromatiales bacterium]